MEVSWSVGPARRHGHRGVDGSPDVGVLMKDVGMEAVTGEDGVARCPWAGGPGAMRDYHDTEWGNRVSGESAYLERLTLEAFQSGLSWSTILNKRPAFREVFREFDAEAVA